MKIDEFFLNQFNQIAKDQNYVFDEVDLKALFGSELDQSFYRTYKKIFELGLLKRFCRGIYVAKGVRLIDINRKLEESSYVSFEYVLAQNSLIGTYSDKKIRSVMKTKRTKKFVFQDNVVEQFRISEELFFGFSSVDGYNIATPEKAYLDCLYFYTKGLRFSINIFSDVNLHLLDHSLINKYLKKYRNNKFVAFVKGLLKDD